MIVCPVSAACLDACWLGELSQQPMCPHSAHRRRWNHQPFADARHSTHPSPLGFEAGLIPRRSLFISRFPFVPSIRIIVSRYQQDLPGTTYLYCCLSLGRFTERPIGPVGSALRPLPAASTCASILMAAVLAAGAIGYRGQHLSNRSDSAVPALTFRGVEAVRLRGLASRGPEQIPA
jgi:hypothetical protein